MKFKITIIFLFIIFNINSQNTYGKIKYTHTTNLAYLYTEKYEMTFNNYEAYSCEFDIKTKTSKKTKEYSSEGLTNKFIKGRSNKKPKFFYKTQTETYFSDIWDKNIYVVKENPFEWKWKLLTKTKKIGGFSCNKATINFRGRDYFAWYTTKIPVPFGPWKFKGLPGVILEVYDTDKKFHITATNIVIEKDNSHAINFNKSELKKVITINEYLKEKKRLIEYEFSKISSKLSKGSKPIKLDENCEDCINTIEIFKDEKKIK